MTAKVIRRQQHNLTCSGCGWSVQILTSENDEKPLHRCRKTGEPAPFDQIEVAK